MVLLLEKRILEYPSLNYFIDIHRDSLTKDKTTVVIDDKEYAKVLFIVGLENKNYKYIGYDFKRHYIYIQKKLCRQIC